MLVIVVVCLLPGGAAAHTALGGPVLCVQMVAGVVAEGEGGSVVGADSVVDFAMQLLLAEVQV